MHWRHDATGFPPVRLAERQRGMTLIEIMVSLCILSVVMSALYVFCAAHQRAYQRQHVAQERDQNLRFALNTIARELMAAGYHAAGDTLVRHLPDWVPGKFVVRAPLPVYMDANPKITLGIGDAPDMITFLLVQPADTFTFAHDSPAVTNQITLGISKSETRGQFKRGDLVCVDHGDTYAIVRNIHQSSLFLDTDPVASGDQPLSAAYPAGTPVGEISMVTYAVFNRLNDPKYKYHEAGCPVLKRRVNASGFQPLAENIADMQVALEDDGRIRITLIAGVAKSFAAPGADGVDGEITATAHVRCRNVSDVGLGAGCGRPSAPADVVVLGALNDTYPCRIFMSWDSVSTDVTGASFEHDVCQVAGYRIYFDVAAGTFGSSIDVPPEVAGGYAVDVSGLPSDSYYVSVAARNGAGVGEKSGEIAVYDLLAPPAPAELVVDVDALGAVNLTWTESRACDLAGYHVYRAIVVEGIAGSYDRISSTLISPNAPEYLDASPPAGQDCRYIVRAEDHGFNLSGKSEAVSVTIPGTPPEAVRP